MCLAKARSPKMLKPNKIEDDNSPPTTHWWKLVPGLRTSFSEISDEFLGLVDVEGEVVVVAPLNQVFCLSPVCWHSANHSGVIVEFAGSMQ